MGILPEAMVNYLATLGWSIPDSVIKEHKQQGLAEEVISLAELISYFDLSNVKSSAPIFNIEKLKWLNGEYIRNLSDGQLTGKLAEFFKQEPDMDLLKKLAPLAKERMKTLSEFSHYFQPFVSYRKSKLSPKDQEVVKLFIDSLAKLPDWRTETLQTASKETVAARDLSLRQALMALRIAVTGEKVGLPLFETMAILGKDQTLIRLTQAVS